LTVSRRPRAGNTSSSRDGLNLRPPARTVPMDPFSHLLLGYLLGFGLWGPSGLPYVVAAAVGGALPDADVALFPLSDRFPLLRHRGISHSIVGVTLIAA